MQRAVAEHAGDVADGAAVGDLDPAPSFIFTVPGYPMKGLYLSAA